MSLPSLSSVLRNIGVGLPGSPPGTAKTAVGGSSSRRQQSRPELLAPAPPKGGGAGGGGTRGVGEPPRPPELEHPLKDHGQDRPMTSTPLNAPRMETPTSSSGGYRRRRHELESMSDELDSPGSALSGCVSECSGSTATYAGGSCADRSGGGWASSSLDGSDHERWDAGDSDRQKQHAIAPLSVTPSAGLSAGMSNAYGTSNSKRAKLEYSRSLPGMSVVGNGTRGRAGLVDKGRVVSAGCLLEQGLTHHSQSHSTDEWRAMSKAARVLGVDSLEERDVEDQRRASMTKAARILGVDNAEELQQNAAASRRQMWAPPRSSASKAARMLGVEDVSELQREAARAAKGRICRRKFTQGIDGNSKPRQGSISSLIRALEHNGISSAEGQNSSEGEESKQGAGNREQMETASALSVHSNRSSATRATESCSSISDFTLPDGDSVGCGTGGARGGVGGGADAHHNQQKPELLDDQMSGLQTPRNLSASDEGGHGRGFSRHSRDEMEIETPPSQPRSAALTSLRQAPAPLLAPYTPSIASSPYRLSPSPVSHLGPGPSPAGSPCTHQMPNAVMRRATDWSTSGTTTDGGSGQSSTQEALDMAADGKGSRRVMTVAEEKERSVMPTAREAMGDEAKPVGRGGWSRGSDDVTAVARDGLVQHRAAQEPLRRSRSSSPLPHPATSGQEAFSWSPSMRSASFPTPEADRKEPRPDRVRTMEVKQEPGTGYGGGRGCHSAESINGSAEEKQGAWPGQHPSPEFKHESDGLPLKQRGAWRPGSGTEVQVALVSNSSAAYPHGIHYPQPQQQSFSQRNSDHLQEHFNQYQQQRHRVHVVGRSPEVTGGADRGFPLPNAGASDSSEESESMCETHPDRMEETEPAPTSAYEALAAMIPVVDPLGITSKQQHAVVGVKAENRSAGVSGFVGGSNMGKAKPRRRSSKTNTWNEDSPALAVAVPAASSSSTTMVAGMPIAHSPVTGISSGVHGISTRKQQEVATRPREKGRFVKRPPAFLPYSAFKRSDESSADAAAEAAEAAEEAREKAAEAAALAAVAAAAAAVERRSGGPTAEGAKLMMSPPAARERSDPWPGLGSGGSGRTGAEESISNGGIYASRGASKSITSSGGGAGGEGRRSNLNASHRGAPSPSPLSPATASRTGTRQACTLPGTATPGRGRTERGASPISRAAAKDIWSANDDDNEKESQAARDRGMSDCGSERGSDDLRGMAFLPWSPMDGTSPRGSAWDSPHRSLVFSSASTPARAKNRSFASPSKPSGVDENGERI